MKLNIKESLHYARYTLTDLVHYALFGRPDAIIVGETHTDGGHVVDQDRLIRRHKPEYVLHEGLDNMEPEDLQDVVESYKAATLGELSKETGIDLEDMGINESVMTGINNEYLKDVEEHTDFYRNKGIGHKKATEMAKNYRDGYLPKTFNELLQTPVYKLNPNTVGVLNNVIFEKAEDHEFRGDHDLTDTVAKFPKMLGHFRRFHQESRIDTIFRSVAQTGGKIAGCDIEKELPTIDIPADASTSNTDSEEEAMRFVKALSDYRDSLSTYVEENNSNRERTMGDRIIGFAEERKTKRPVMAIVGANHAKPDSDIYPVLEDAGIKYRVITQRHLRRSVLGNFFYTFELGQE
jgi:hypothetical protein